jgi:hypothetical protein
VFGKLLDLGASGQNDKCRGEGADSFLLCFVLRTAVTYNRNDRLVSCGAVRWTFLWTTLGGTVLCLSDLSRRVSDLLAPSHGSVVKVDYATTMIWLRFDLDPLRCFGLGSLGRR